MRRLLIAALAVTATHVAPAWESVTGELVARCRQPEFTVLECEYRTPGGGPTAVTLVTDAGTAEPRERQAYPWNSARTEFLLLVDTSDPGRAPVLAANVAQVTALARNLRSHQRARLARFDKELEVLAAQGSGADVAGAAGRLHAGGMTTELYRNLLRAVGMLAGIEADRRYIILFSDGQAEDTAYFHGDVVEAARAAGIGIISLGFPRSVARSVALQSLRRLSEETGSLYLEADLAGNLPAGFEQAVLGSADDGARVMFTLPGVGADGGGDATGTLLFQRGTRQIRHEIPIRTRAAAAKAAPVATTAAPPAFRPAPAPAPRTDAWIWYGVPALLLLLVLLALATLVLLYRQPRRAPGADTGAQAHLPRPFAYLISQTSHPKRFPIAGAIWRIGRSRENELVLDDISISRRHAEIQRGTDGHFTVLDRGSRNGVYVNGQQVRLHVLQEGDMIEIGDMVLRFTEQGADEQLQDPTAMQHTRQPRVA